MVVVVVVAVVVMPVVVTPVVVIAVVVMPVVVMAVVAMMVMVVAVVTAAVLVVGGRGALGNQRMCGGRYNMAHRAGDLMRRGRRVADAAKCGHHDEGARCQSYRHRIPRRSSTLVRARLLGNRRDEVLTSHRSACA